MEEFKMNKYEIKRVDLDNYILEYKDKKLKFKSDVSVTARMQACNKIGKLKALEELSKNGKSLKDYVIEKKENGKTYVDNSNKTEVLNTFIEEEMAETFDKIIKEKFNMNLQQLVTDIGLSSEEEVEIFSEKLSYALTGNTPR